MASWMAKLKKWGVVAGAIGTIVGCLLALNQAKELYDKSHTAKVMLDASIGSLQTNSVAAREELKAVKGDVAAIKTQVDRLEGKVDVLVTRRLVADPTQPFSVAGRTTYVPN